MNYGLEQGTDDQKWSELALHSFFSVISSQYLRKKICEIQNTENKSKNKCNRLLILGLFSYV